MRAKTIHHIRVYTSWMQVEILSNEAPQPSFAPLGSSLKVLLVWPRFPPSFWGFEGLLK
jgi:hypothetical protein